jgi:hypothetical protein
MITCLFISLSSHNQVLPSLNVFLLCPVSLLVSFLLYYDLQSHLDFIEFIHPEFLSITRTVEDQVVGHPRKWAIKHIARELQ